MGNEVINLVISRLNRLSEDKQRQVLQYAETLKPPIPEGVKGDELLVFAGTIPAGDLQLMIAAIEEGCEQVDPNEW
jgi:hypothetical protein